ncbi:hypothetical protein HGM15179_003517 [Zosterops borbonicus]|uniref:Uncharacterized protein n=1 Tax=Zosterops borbonicus TaxID=364589 RepID=A0A8K1GUJ9_9PASS|nr:hypothetical protein HGM15179_003517 [Zosterops borbonicus]
MGSGGIWVGFGGDQTGGIRWDQTGGMQIGSWLDQMGRIRVGTDRIRVGIRAGIRWDQAASGQGSGQDQTGCTRDQMGLGQGSDGIRAGTRAGSDGIRAGIRTESDGIRAGSDGIGRGRAGRSRRAEGAT